MKHANSGRRPLVRAGLFLFLGCALRAADPAPLSASDTQFFESKIRPLLAEKCYNCHSKQADKVRGGLLLDSREALLQGGNTSAAIIPGKPEQSLLIQAITYKNEDLQMPPENSGGKLSDQQIADLTEWVRRGAPDPRTLVAKGSSSAYGGVGKNHWSFQPVKKPTVPSVQNAAWPKNPIDNFVLAKLETAGMAPNSPAEKATLIRRVYFDLVGLPPTVREVQAFINDASPEAFTTIVDRLLASRQYGEHWARYWLDVARYSDTKGDPARQEDFRFPHAWTYRDWVIDAFNADLPYDKFILAQIAGDKFQAAIDKKAKEAGQTVQSRSMLAALGFLTLGNQFDGRKDDIIGDQIDVTTKAFLGLTVACARCHDHKFDPIPTKDYYSLYGVFANCTVPLEQPTMLAKVPETSDLLDYLKKAAELEKRGKEVEEKQLELRRSMAATKKGGATKATKGKQPGAAANPEIAKQQKELQKMRKQLAREEGDLESTHPGTPARANTLVDLPPSRIRDYPVLLRGEVGNRGDVVPRRFLEVLSPDPKKRPEWKEGSGRVQLAQAIADPKNPLTARVFVNRMWQQHWGVGFVPTPDDLGNMSAPPTHPELLDWLAATFVENGWSIKQLHRLIVTSAAYQQSSKNNPQYAEQDPNNTLLWRYNLRRLTFEQVHDALLAITGELDGTRGGRPIAISSSEFAKRRSIYTLIDRSNPPELLTQFDFPSPDVESGRRYETLVPQQALFLMNSPMVIETARKLTSYPAFAELKSDEERVAALYLAIYQRMPTKQEIALGSRYVKLNPQGTATELPEPVLSQQQINAREQRKMLKQAQSKGGGRFNQQVGGVYDNTVPLTAWTKLAHALFQSNEAMFYN